MRLEDLPPVPGVTHRFVEAGDVRLHIAEAGSGPPLLLVHGWPQHWWAYRKVIPRLAERWRVLAVDLRGWGWSDAPPGEYLKQTFANDLLALLDAEGIDQVTILGHDWGGYASFLLAMDHPDRVERLTVLDVPPPWRPPVRATTPLLPVMLSYQLPIVTPGLGYRLHRNGQIVRLVCRVGAGRNWSFSDEEIACFVEPLREPARARASVAVYRTLLLREVGRTGRHPDELTVPTKLIMGDGLFYKVARPEPTAHLSVEMVPGAGHFLAEEAPDEVLRRSGLMT
jgi:pimeloyl-ACP methyl ester carboxylesterase